MQYIQIKDKQIKLIIREYRNSNVVRMYFKGTTLNISKPKIMSKRSLEKMIKENEEEIYNQYKKIISSENNNIKHWQTGEKIMYKGEEFKIELKEREDQLIKIFINREEKKFEIGIPQNMDEEEKKEEIDKTIKQLFKINTEAIISEKLPYWSQKTKIEYAQFKIGDATSKFGSCIPSKKILHFSNRLIMLPPDKVDAIIVHELCHIVQDNHSKNFYNLVKKYIPNYEEIEKWLKENTNVIMI